MHEHVFHLRLGIPAENLSAQDQQKLVADAGYAVCDTGSRIPPENMNRIFDPFFNTSRSPAAPVSFFPPSTKPERLSRCGSPEQARRGRIVAVGTPGRGPLEPAAFCRVLPGYVIDLL